MLPTLTGFNLLLNVRGVINPTTHPPSKPATKPNEVFRNVFRLIYFSYFGFNFGIIDFGVKYFEASNFARIFTTNL